MKGSKKIGKVGWRELVLVLLLFAGVCFGFFGEVIVQNKSLTPIQHLYRNDSLYLGSEAATELAGQRSNDLMSDLYNQFYPWADFSFASFRDGEVPFWSPYNLAGLPFLANSQSSIFEVSQLLGFLFSVGADDILLFTGFVTFLMAGFVTYLFLRNLRVGRAGAVVAGCAFAFSGPMVAWMGFPLATTAAWLPFILLAIDRVVRTGRWYWVGLLALGIGAQFFAGNPQVSLFILGLAGAFAIFRLGQAWRRRRLVKKCDVKLGREGDALDGRARGGVWTSVGLIVLGVVAGAAIAAVQVGPAFEFISQSRAYEIGRAEKADVGLVGAMQNGEWNGWRSENRFLNGVGNLALVIDPGFYGDPSKDNYWLPGWEEFEIYDSNYNEKAVYVGVAALVFALIGIVGGFAWRRRRGEIIFWTVVAGVVLGIAAHVPVFELANYVPGLDRVNIDRVRFIFVFSAAVLAGFGVEFTVRVFRKGAAERLAQWRKWIVALANLFFGVAVLLFFAIQNLIMTRSPEFQPDPVMFRAELALLLAVLIGLNLLFWLACLRKSLIWQVLLVGLVVAELFFYGIGYHPAVAKEHLFPETEVTRLLQEDAEGARVTSDFRIGREAMVANTNMVWGLRDVRGYEVVIPRRFDQFQERFIQGDLGEFNEKVMSLLGVRYLIVGRGGGDELSEGLRKNPDTEVVYEDELLFVVKNEAALLRAFFVEEVLAVRDFEEALDVLGGEEFDPGTQAVVEGIDEAELSESESSDRDYDGGVDGGTLKAGAKIVKDKANEVVIETETDRARFLVLSDSFYPGWRAFVDGAEVQVYPTDGAFRGVVVSAGEHEVAFRYRPSHWRWFVVATGVGLGVVGVAFVLTLVRRRGRRAS